MKLEKAADILEVAVRIERRSVEFYLALFRQVRSSRAKEIFSILAAEEEKHLGRLRVLLERVSEDPPRYLYPGEYELFVDGAAARTLESCSDGRRMAAATSAREALLLAGDLEKCLVDFYAGVSDAFGGEDRAALDALLSEEKGHLGKIVELLGTFPDADAGEDPAGGR